jgi:hypothetical protein
MLHHIAWRLLFRVKDLHKAQGRVEAVCQTLGVELAVTVCEQYWKIPELWECSLVSKDEEKPLPVAVFDCLMLASQLGNGWYVQGPLVNSSALAIFEGVFDLQKSSTPHVAGLEWGSFSIIPQQEDGR